MAVITVSRQLGSAGDLVAARAAETLDYELVDKTLITEVAREANVSESEVEQYDEQSLSPVKRFLHSLITPSDSVPVPPAMLWGLEYPYEVSAALLADEGAQSEAKHFLDHKSYLNFLRAAVHRLAKRGNVIIVGRGGQAILGDSPDILHFRTIAPLPDRIRIVMERRNVGEPEAREMISASDRRRAAYLRDNYAIDWNDPTLYHAVLNCGLTSQNAAAQILVDAVQIVLNDPPQAPPA